MTTEDIEAAAKRVDKALTCDDASDLPWENTNKTYRNHCRRIAAAALNVEETE